MGIGIIRMDQYRARPLLKLEGFWRVDGTSNVESANEGLKISFVLSRLRDDYSDPFSSTARLDIDPKILVLNPSWLSILTIGSIWENGSRVSKPGRLSRSLEIDTSQAVNKATNLIDKHAKQSITANDLLEKKDFKHLSATLYSIVPIIGDKQFKWMVIPHAEIFRFYVAVSGRIAKRVLRGEADHLIDLSKPTGNDPVTIFERVVLKDVEAKFFGRVQANPAFKEEILQVNKRISVINATNSLTGDRVPLALEAHFPFSGRTSLSVAGVPMRLANEPAIYVMEILHCTYPLGFTAITLESAGTQATGGIPGNKGKGHKTLNVPHRDPDDEDDEIDDLPADANLQRREVPQNSSPFPDDIEIIIERNRSLTLKELIANYVSAEGEVDGLTLGDGIRATSDNLRGVDDVKEEAPAAARALKDFFAMIEDFEKIAREKKWIVSSRALNGSIPLTQGGSQQSKHIITSLPMLAGKQRRWHLVNTEDDVRPRQLACVEVESSRTQRYFYILEVELKGNEPGQCTLLVRRCDYKRISDKDFHSLLKLTCYKNRWPDFSTDVWKKSRHRLLAEKFSKEHISKKLHHPKRREHWCVNLTSNIFKWLKDAEPDQISP